MSKARQVTQLLDEAAFTRQAAGGVFLVIQGPERGTSVKLRDTAITFGSDSTSTMVLTDATVSRQHLQAELVDGTVFVQDLGSRNGTTLEGARVTRTSIGFGAEIALGRTVVKFLPDEEEVRPQAAATTAFGSIVGGDTKMRQLFAMLQNVAPTHATVLIEGETGTGKELIAEEIHKHSDRKNGPFVVFDCGAVPRELIESLLFGHVKGSFTGAIADKKGAFAEAHGGTIFLDEIGEMAIDLQPALLRVLDKRTVRKVGSNVFENIDVRVVAATNRDLRQEVQNRNFREDLYYRLAVIRVSVPPLRERDTDLELLIRHFVRIFAPQLTVAPGDMARLLAHEWPGNVRELKNTIERACVLASGSTIHLDASFANPQPARASQPTLSRAEPVRTDLPFKEAKGQLVEAFEREYLEGLMKKHRSNLSAASREAEIDRKHLRELVRKYGLTAREDD